MLDDWAKIWVAVSSSVGCASASWNVDPSISVWSGTEKLVLGLMMPSWSAAENVTSLNTDPGSYAWVRARLDGASLTGWEVPEISPRPSLPRTRLAMARMSPVLVSITTAIPLWAPVEAISSPRADSVTYWSGWSMVSSIPVPPAPADRVSWDP